MADETILIDIEFESNAAEEEKKIDDLTASIEGNKIAMAQLAEETKKGNVSQVESSKQKAKLQTQLQTENKQRKDLIKIMQSEKGSRDQMRQSISDLIRKRNSLNTSTKTGERASKKLEKQINKLDKAYQKSGTATEKAKGNVGKYGQAMNGLPGPINGVITSMKTLAKVIFATPLGWLIGLIAGAGLALKAFFTGSAEGQERWNKTMNRAKGVMSVFKDELIKAGKSISNFTDNLKSSEGGISGWAASVKDKAQGAWKNLKKDVEDKGLWTALKDNAGDAVDSIKNKFEELGDAVDENAARADAISARQNELRRDEIDTLTQVATLRKEIAEARANSADKEGTTAQQRLEFLDEAIAKENEILVIEENLAAERVKIQELQMAQGENTLEDYEQLAQLEKAQIDLETTNAMARRKIQSERQTALREAAAEEKALRDETFLSDQELVELENELELEQIAEQNALKLELQATHDDLVKQQHAEVEEEKTERTKEGEEKRKALIEQSFAAIQNIAQQSGQFLLDLNQSRFDADIALLEKQGLSDAEFNKKKLKLEKDFARKQKKTAIANAIIGGSLAIIQAFAQLGPIAGAISAVLVGATTAFQIARINSQKFKNGGQVPLAKKGMKFGTFNGPSHSSGGIPLVNGLTGQTLAEVEGKENFYVVNKHASAFLNGISDVNQRIGGGVSLTGTATRPKMQDGGRAEVEGSQPGVNINDITKQVVERLPPIVVQTVDIKTGLEDRNDVVNAGVI